ncbi:bacterial transferase hexapeptide domain containing protein [Musa troglodytarum]|uniref:Bacterial transferase hexapeptide domain containing protein n=1 Tax=Musa troglodytarum TaxID=320322 RepID=A0A9E7JMG0_9LILI|nr:bacterial transferase hexapeptide domain containing protein [Musa troglodytarum]
MPSLSMRSSLRKYCARSLLAGMRSMIRCLEWSAKFLRS